MPRIGERGWIHSGVKVYDNADAPTSWTDLNLSAVVGKNRALVCVKIKNRCYVGYETYYVRIKGETEEVARGSSYGGMNNLVSTIHGNIAHFVIETDANGFLEWKGSGVSETDIWVIGYIR